MSLAVNGNGELSIKHTVDARARLHSKVFRGQWLRESAWAKFVPGMWVNV